MKKPDNDTPEIPKRSDTERAPFQTVIGKDGTKLLCVSDNWLKRIGRADAFQIESCEGENENDN